MEKRKHDSLIFCMGLDGLKIWASGFSALVLSLGAAVGLIGFSIYYLSKAAGGVQLQSASGLGALLLSVALAIAFRTGIGMAIFRWIKALINKIQEMC
uniref:Uncharacterized protein n=1 Tax=Myotis myotis TaxID=51298 RepID=A0A7J7Y189_MYOMY|nr:hypothetical protein mMyoMyo1_011498 [Myotis myotis]